MTDWRTTPVRTDDDVAGFLAAHVASILRPDRRAVLLDVAPLDPASDYLRVRAEGATLAEACEAARRALYPISCGPSRPGESGAPGPRLHPGYTE